MPFITDGELAEIVEWTAEHCDLCTVSVEEVCTTCIIRRMQVKLKEAE